MVCIIDLFKNSSILLFFEQIRINFFQFPWNRVEGPTTADDLTTADYDRNNKITTLQMSKKN